MTARDELIRWAKQLADPDWCLSVPKEAKDAITRLVAELEPRTITTEAELDALPVGSVIRTSGLDFHTEPRVAIKSGFWHNESEWFVADDSEWCLSSDELDDLPATVLHEGTTP